MINIPRICSEQQFKDNFLEEIDKWEDTFYISIIDPGDEELAEETQIFKTFKIWDIPYDINNYKAFNYEDAQKMYKYIKANEGKGLVVHCGAGISRSAAVAEFYFEMSGGSYKDLTAKYKNIMPNLTPILLYLRMAERNNGEEIKIQFT